MISKAWLHNCGCVFIIITEQGHQFLHYDLQCDKHAKEYDENGVLEQTASRIMEL